MSPGESDVPMISDEYDIDAFFKAIEGKNLTEIISFADQEATAAWRRSYRRHKVDEPIDTLPGRYEHTLEALISFLRAALVYKPFKIDQPLFDQFVKLRSQVVDKKSSSNRPFSQENQLC